MIVLNDVVVSNNIDIILIITIQNIPHNAAVVTYTQTTNTAMLSVLLA